jgi:hypothetical protein
VAGEKIYFPIGGESDAQGNLPIRFPSTRFGLSTGSNVSTSSEHGEAYVRSPIPAGLTLGKGHVQVDLIYARLPEGLRRGLDAFSSLLAGILFSLMAWFAFGKAAHSLRRGIYRGWMKLPEYPAKYLFAFGCLLTALTFFILFFNALAVGKNTSRLTDELQ